MTPVSDDTPPARLQALTSRLLTRTATRTHRLVAGRLAEAGATRYHYSLLAAAAEFGPASQAELGRRCGLDRSDVVATVNELAAQDLVRRSPDPADRRRNTITITPAGTRALGRLDAVLADTQDELLAPLSPEERGELARLLTVLLTHHDRPDPGPGEPAP
ncbi:MarR family winged helix-turn-helix transcriptional regulator [Nocardiopsis sediminis]|uniref:MarR family winged helix-turn-helix transcriptional regulator n=1 Tax=Nocardiopsis sediminis TaxID=1778267 RepID=A0ABV8FKP8_9ACTN